MKDFHFIGEPMGLVLTRLGLPQETLIKIRRKISSGILRQMSMSLEENASLRLPNGSQGLASAGGRSMMECNQRTFKAEGMYSYRVRAESLWGTKDDLGDNSAQSATTKERVPRKRWASDADADDVCVVSVPTATQDKEEKEEETKVVDSDTSSTPTAETYTDIYPVSAAEPVQAGDVLFLSCAQATMIDFQAITVSQRLKGLKFLEVSALDLPGHGTEFFEVVLSGHNRFVGRSAGRDHSAFAAYYGCNVVAVRRRGSAEATTSVVPPPTGHAASVASSSAGLGSSSKAAVDAAEARLEAGLSAKSAFNPDADPLASATPMGTQLTQRPEAAGVAVADRSSRENGRSPSKAGGTPPRSPPQLPRAVKSTASVALSTRSPARGLLRKDSVKSAATEEATGIEVAQRAFKAGDVILVLAEEEFFDKFSSSKDFFLLTKVGSVPKPVRPFDYLPILAFLAMLIVVLLDVEMVRGRVFTRSLFLVCSPLLNEEILSLCMGLFLEHGGITVCV